MTITDTELLKRALPYLHQTMRAQLEEQLPDFAALVARGSMLDRAAARINPDLAATIAVIEQRVQSEGALAQINAAIEAAFARAQNDSAQSLGGAIEYHEAVGEYRAIK